jgi:hypothetical protein
VIKRVTNLGAAQRCTASQCNGGVAPESSSNHSTCVRRTAVVDISLDVEDIPDNYWNEERIAEANNDVRNDLAAGPGLLWLKALLRLLTLRQLKICPRHYGLGNFLNSSTRSEIVASRREQSTTVRIQAITSTLLSAAPVGKYLEESPLYAS